MRTNAHKLLASAKCDITASIERGEVESIRVVYLVMMHNPACID